MNEQTTDEFSQAKGKMADDLRTVIADGEDLIRAAANLSGAGIVAARDRFDEKLSRAKARAGDAAQPAVDNARKTAAATNRYVHGNPWAVIGVAAAAGALIGFLASRRARHAASSNDFDS